MAARISPALGKKGDKLWRDAISVALHEKATGKKTTKLRAMAEKTVELALQGDMQAIKEIGDRMDGKPNQSIDNTHDVSDNLSALMASYDRTKGK